MKRLLRFLSVLLLLIGITEAANAALWDRGGGLIYDSVLNVTWLQDANYGRTTDYLFPHGNWNGEMAWEDAKNFVSNLSYYDSVRNTTWTDWRLPKTLPVNGTEYNYNSSYTGSTDAGYNISNLGSAYPGSTASEMAYMYYINLGNKGYWDVNGVYQPDRGLKNSGPFQNLQAGFYWSDTEQSQYDAWYFNFYLGGQNSTFKGSYREIYAWAVRDGDVGSTPVPVPATIILLGSGLIGLVGFNRKKRVQ